MINAVQPGDLLDQVHLLFEVHAEAGNDHHAIFGGVVDGYFEAELLEKFYVFRGGKFYAEQFADFVGAERELLEFGRMRECVHDTVGELAAGGLQNELCGAPAGPITDANIPAALEAIRRFRAQLEFLGGGADVLWLEIGALDQDVHRLVIDLGVLATHDTGKGDGFGFIGDQQHLAGERPLLGIERRELLVLGGAADDDGGLPFPALRDEVIIEGVQRLAGFEHHVVRDVHDVADAADTDFFERRAEPIGTGANLHAPNYTGGVPRAEFGVVEADGDEALNARTTGIGRKRNVRHFQRVARNGADLAGDANNAVEVGAIGSDFEIVDHITGGAAEIFSDRLADLCVLGKNQEAIHLVGQAKFLG